MKKKNLRTKLVLNKKTIAPLAAGEAVKGGAGTQADCMTPPYTIAFQTVCCKTWPPNCSQWQPCLG